MESQNVISMQVVNMFSLIEDRLLVAYIVLIHFSSCIFVTSPLAMADDKKRYNYMEKVLNDVSGAYVSLSAEDIKKNNQILREVVRVVTEKMREKDPLFKAMFQRVFYGGSFYDDLRVKKPDEFDLDLLLCIPKLAEPTLTTSNIPGFVHLQVKNLQAWMRQPEAQPAYRNFDKLLDEKMFLSTAKVLAWVQSVLDKALNDFPKNGNKRVVSEKGGKFEVMFRKGGPALTLILTGPGGLKMDIDLVTCFVFDQDKWPSAGFRKNPVPLKPQFFIVPKAPKVRDNEPAQRYWRLSFQEQERALITVTGRLKPTLRLIKKLRDKLGHASISSYYIKTVFLWTVEQKKAEPQFWNSSLSYLFMTILKSYREYIQDGNIPYYWNKNNNLLGSINSKTLENISQRLKAVIDTIERNSHEPMTVCKFLLETEEYNKFIKENSGSCPAQKEAENSCNIS